jgi:hypothetical protein
MTNGLHLAASTGKHNNVVSEICDSCVCVLTVVSFLQDLVVAGDKTMVSKLVAQHGVESKTDTCGGTALMCACTRGHLTIAQWLVNEGASIHCRRIGGGTALHAACFRGHLEIAQWLVQLGVSP